MALYAEGLINELSACCRNYDNSAQQNAKEKISILSKQFEEKGLDCDKDLLIAITFNENWGIHSFITEGVKQPCLHEAVKKALNLITYICENFPSKLEKHSKLVIDAAKACAVNYNASATLRASSLDVITNLLKKLKYVELTSILTMIDNLVSWQKRVEPTFTHAMFKLIGVVTEHHLSSVLEYERQKEEREGRSQINEYKFVKQLMSDVLYILKSTNEKDSDTGKKTLLEGCFEALTGLLVADCYSPDEYKEIYKYTKLVLQSKDEHRRVHQRKALKLINIHLLLFSKLVCNEYKWWHDTMLQWFKDNNNKEDREVGLKAYNAFVQEVARLLHESETVSENEDLKKLFQFFIKYFTDCLKQSDVASEEEFSIAIMGIGKFAYVFNKVMKPEDIEVMFGHILQRTQHISDTDSVDQIPDYLEALSDICCELKGRLSDHHLAALERLVILLLEQYPKIGMKLRTQAATSVVSCIFSVGKAGSETELKKFVSVVVYQGLIRACIHKIPLDSDSEQDEITVKQYIRLWQDILSVRTRFKLHRKEIPREEEQNISNKIWDTFIDSVIVILNKIDVSTRKKNLEECNWLSDPEAALEPNNLQDFTILYNLQILCSSVMTVCLYKDFSRHWLSTLTETIVTLSSRNPLICPFYDLLSTLLSIAVKTDYFQDEFEASKDCKHIVINYLEDILINLHQYQASVQVSCLKVVTAAPVSLIQGLMQHLPPAFKVVFKIGCGQIELARLGVEALERWIDELTTDQLKPFLHEVIPHLHPFLHTRSLIIDDLFGDVNESLPSKRSQRYKKMTQLQLNSDISETELSKLQKRILLLLGRLDTPFLLSLLDQDYTASVISWNLAPILPFEVKFPNMSKFPIIYLDRFAPRVTELALTSGDRKTRAASYEVLQAIYIIFLGQTVHSARRTLEPAVHFLKRLLPKLYQLACSTDSIARQMFSQLLLESCHWYSSKFCLFDAQLPYTHVFIEAIFDALTHSTDSAVRDFGAKCLCEFVTWAVKQLPEDQLEKGPLNIKAVIMKLNMYCLHPCNYKREGAALGFNAMYRQLREEISVVKTFWLEMLYYYFKSLSLSCSNQSTLEALDHISRVIIQKPELFNKVTKSEKRRQPPEFTGVLLMDAVCWLLTQCSSVYTDCQRKGIELVTLLSPHVSGYKSAADFLQKIIFQQEKGNMDKLVMLCEGGGKETLLEIRPSTAHIEAVLSWLNHMHASIYCYSWLQQENIDVLHIVLSSKSRLLDSLRYFICEISSCSPGKVVENLSDPNVPVYLTTRQIDQYSKIKCNLTLAVFKFLTNLQSNITRFPEDFWSNNFWMWITRCIICPPLIGFDNINAAYVKKIEPTLLKLIPAILGNLDKRYKDEFFKCVSDELQKKNLELSSVLGISLHLQESDSVVLKTLPHLLKYGCHQTSVHKHYINALLLLNKLRILNSLENVWKYNSWNKNLVQEVFMVLTDDESGAATDLEKGITKYISSVLNFAFQMNSQVDLTLDCILNTDELKRSRQLFKITKGKYFLSLFSDEIFNHLLNNTDQTVDRLVKHLNLCDTSSMGNCNSFGVSIVKQLLEKARNQPSYVKSNLVNRIMSQWFTVALKSNTLLENKRDLLTVLSNLIFLIPDKNLRCFEGSSVVIMFLYNELRKYENSDLDYKTLILEMLPALVKRADDSLDPELWNVLSAFRSNYFPVKSSDYERGCQRRITYAAAFTALLKALRCTGNSTILKTVVVVAAGDKEHPCVNEIRQTLFAFKGFGYAVQLSALQEAYSVFKDKRDNTRRLAAVKDFVLPLLGVSNSESILKFFENNVEELYKMITEGKSYNTKIEEDLTNKAGSFMLIDAMFTYISKDTLTAENNVIGVKVSRLSNILEPKRRIEPKTCNKAFISCAVQVRKVELPSGSSEEVVNLFYKYQCAAFNSLITIISNTVPSGEGLVISYDVCIFKDTGNNASVWKKIIPCDKTFEFSMDFDEIPVRRKQLIGIRRAVRSERDSDSLNASTSTSYVSYSSQSRAFFNSTLHEDLSAFDFCNSLVRTDANVEIQRTEDLNRTEVTLEADILNTHDCMAPLCGLIEHLSSTETLTTNENIPSRVSDNNGQEKEMPFWMKSLVSLIERQAKNVRLFILKVIINCQRFFKPYAKHWIVPIIRTINDGCVGNSINYVIADAVKMIVSWSSIVSTVEDVDQLQTLVKFLFTNVPHDRTNVFKFNIEILRDIVEAWKYNVASCSMHDEILRKLLSCRKIEVMAAIEMSAIYLLHDIQPYSDTGKKLFFETLLKHVWETGLANISSEALGLCFRFLTQDCKNPLNEDDEEFLNKVICEIKSKTSNVQEVTKAINCLHYIQRHYPLIVKSFTQFALSLLGRVQANVRSNVLKILIGVLDFEPEDCAEQILSHYSIMSIIKTPCATNQPLALMIISKILPTLNDEKLTHIVTEVIRIFAVDKNIKSREVLYDILIWTYEKSSTSDSLKNLHETVRVKLLNGLHDTNDELRNKIVEFWRKTNHLHNGLNERMTDVFTTLYSSESEPYFIGSAASFLLDICSLSPNSKDKLFNEPLANCKMEEMKFDTSWHKSNLHIMPLFVPSISTQMSNSFSVDSEVPSTSSGAGVRATQHRSLEFQPTPSLAASLNQTFGASSLASLSYQTKNSNTYRASQSGSHSNENSLSPGKREHLFTVPSSHRFIKKRKQDGKIFAEKQMKQNAELGNEVAKKKAKLEKEVNLMRTYRKGDFPDIEITFHDVLNHLQVLAERDSTLASQLMVCLLESIINEPSIKEDINVIIKSLNDAFNNILSATKTPSVVSTIFEILLKFNNLLKVDSETVTEVSKRSGLLSLGSLLLETKLIKSCNNTDPPPAKRIKTTHPMSKEMWAQLAQVYRSMGEDDIVQGIFEDKLANVRVCDALESEALGQLKTATDQYYNLIQDETLNSDEPQKDFLYEAFFKCSEKMANWTGLNKYVAEVVGSDLDELWKINWYKECLLPWFFTSGAQCSLEKPSSYNKLIGSVLSEWLKNKEKSVYIKEYFGEQLAIFYLIEGKRELAKVTSQQNVSIFLDDWAQLPPLAHKLIINKCFQLQSLMEIHSFLLLPCMPHIRGVKDSNTVKWCSEVDNLLKKWQSNSPSKFDSLTFWEARTKYRNYFCSVLCDQAKELKENNLTNKILSASQNMWFSLLDSALYQQNYYVAKKIIDIKKSKHVDGDLWLLNKSRSRLLLAKEYGSNISKLLKTAILAWTDIEPLESKSDKDLSFKLSFHCHINEICKCLFTCIEEHPGEWSELQVEYNNEKQWLLRKITLEDDNAQTVVGELFERGLKNLLTATQITDEFYELKAKTDIEQQKYACETAETYLKLAKYCLKQHHIHGKVECNEIMIKSLLRSMHHGSVEARQLFPCLLVLPTLASQHKDVFISESAEVPEWMFLSWVSQLLANLDTDIGVVLHPLILRLARSYPNALQIPFHLSCSKYTYKYHETKEFVNQLESLLAYNQVTEDFLRALQCVNMPEVVLLYHVKQIIKALKSDYSAQLLDSRWKQLFENSFRGRQDTFKGPLYDKYKTIKPELEQLQKELKGKYQAAEVINNLEKIMEKIQSIYRNEKRTTDQLKSVSPWLHKFSRLCGVIEIPGQYNGDSKPIPNLNIKICHFNITIKVLASLRRPVKIGILGHDGIERGFLVKYGEDLRQDQRIQQLLKLMNQILKTSNSSGRNMSLGTYSVVPITGCFGLISWVDNTETLLQFIKSFAGEENSVVEELRTKHMQWIQCSKDINNKTISRDYMKAYINFSRDVTVNEFNKRVTALPDDLFRRCFQKLSQSMVAYHYLRSQLGSSLAVLCICHWILGIGDRHLGNTLVCMNDGQLLGIDFGYAFGAATQYLGVPELIPFRLTPQILNLFSPFRETGLIKETMIQCLTSLKKHESVIMAAMDVFVQEPSLNWLEFVNEKADDEQSIVDNLSWLPNEKVILAKRKLTGANPMKITLEELTAGHQDKGDVFQRMADVLKGEPNSIRSSKCSDNLTPKDQVECLIDQATDQHILGKTYVGWDPWI